LEQEEDYIREEVKKIVQAGVNVVVCQKEIDDLAKHYLANASVLAIEKVKRSDMDILARTTGGRISTNLENLKCLGSCEIVEEQKMGEVPMTVFSQPTNSAVTLLLRGGTAPFVEEIERAFNDAVGVVAVAHEDNAVLAGGGSVFAALSHKLTQHASEIDGRESMAFRAFSDALEVIPRTLAENAGFDPVDEMMALRKAHGEGHIFHGVDVLNGGITDMRELGVYEPQRVIEQAIKSAVETATMILRIDDVISSRKGGPP